MTEPRRILSPGLRTSKLIIRLLFTAGMVGTFHEFGLLLQSGLCLGLTEFLGSEVAKHLGENLEESISHLAPHAAWDWLKESLAEERTHAAATSSVDLTRAIIKSLITAFQNDSLIPPKAKTTWVRHLRATLKDEEKLKSFFKASESNVHNLLELDLIDVVQREAPLEHVLWKDVERELTEAYPAGTRYYSGLSDRTLPQLRRTFAELIFEEPLLTAKVSYYSHQLLLHQQGTNSRQLQEIAGLLSQVIDQLSSSDRVSAFVAQSSDDLPSGAVRALEVSIGVRLDELARHVNLAANTVIDTLSLRFDALEEHHSRGIQVGRSLSFGIPGLPSRFCGRDGELRILTSELSQTGQGGRRIAVTGFSGVGKSSLVAAYALANPSHFSSIIWLQAQSVNVRNAALELFAKDELGIDAEALPEDHVRAALNYIRSEQRILLILDNVEDLSEAASFLSKFSAVYVVVTTRSTEFASIFTEIRIEPLTREAGRQLLIEVSGSSGKGREIAAADRLACRFGQLPLLLDHAGHYCRLCGWSLEQLDLKWASERKPLLKAFKNSGRNLNQDLWSLVWKSFKKIRGAGPRDLVRYLAYMNPDGISPDVFLLPPRAWGFPLKRCLRNSQSRARLYEELLRSGLVQWRKVKPTESEGPEYSLLTMHRAVQEVIRLGQSRQLARRTIMGLAIPVIMGGPDPDLAKLAPILSVDAIVDDEAVDSLTCRVVAALYRSQCLYQLNVLEDPEAAIVSCQKVEQLLSNRGKADPESMADCLLQMARAYLTRGEYQQAIEILCKGERLLGKPRGGGRYIWAHLRRCHGQVLYASEEISAAVTALADAAAVYRGSIFTARWDLLGPCLMEMGWAYDELQDYRSALAAFQEAVGAFEIIKPDQLSSLLVSARWAVAMASELEDPQVEVEAISTAIVLLAENDPDSLEVVFDYHLPLARAFMKLAKPEDAQRALELAEQLLLSSGQDSYHFMPRGYTELSNIYIEFGNLAEAEEVLRRGKLRLAEFENDAEGIAILDFQMGLVLEDALNFDAARAQFALATDSFRLTNSWASLAASLYREAKVLPSGNDARAIILLREALLTVLDHNIEDENALGAIAWRLKRLNVDPILIAASEGRIEASQRIAGELGMYESIVFQGQVVDD